MSGDSATVPPLGALHAGSNERALEKAKTLPVDALIFDLEDAVAPTTRTAARENACAAAGIRRVRAARATIRVNGRGTALG